MVSKLAHVWCIGQGGWCEWRRLGDAQLGERHFEGGRAVVGVRAERDDAQLAGASGRDGRLTLSTQLGDEHLVADRLGLRDDLLERVRRLLAFGRLALHGDEARLADGHLHDGAHSRTRREAP
jgi:hypothetical protein